MVVTSTGWTHATAMRDATNNTLNAFEDRRRPGVPGATCPPGAWHPDKRSRLGEAVRNESQPTLWIAADRLFVDVIAAAQRAVSTCGIIVHDLDNNGQKIILGVLSASTLARELAKPHLRERYERKPLAEVLKIWPAKVTELASSTLLEDAVEVLLARPEASRFEPVLLRDGEDARLVSCESILLAQCRAHEEHVHRMKAAERELQRIAAEDPLTGLLNRRGFGSRLQAAIDRHARDPRCHFAVFYIDVDRFKWVNDSLGHEAGDELLASISTRIRSALRASDVVARGGEAAHAADAAARIGGDEFLILLDDLCDPNDAVTVAKRLLARLEPTHQIRSHEICSTASIGITSSRRPYRDASEALRDADLAMYRAKVEGGGRYTLFDEQMHEQAMFRLTAEALLRTAADRDELTLMYQPIVNLQTGAATGHEALMRWNSAELGFVSPAQFIPVAEESGVIVELGRWALDRALSDVAVWRELGSTHTINVNLSPRQLGDDRLPTELDRLLELHGVPASQLRLEVTETSLMHDKSRGVALLRRLRERGVKIVLDDFGTGYSSLACLQQLPLDGVKLDRSFISQITEDPRQVGIVRAMVTLAAEFEFDLVAEGVETTEQAQLLADIGVRRAQGFLFAKPQLAKSVTDGLRDAPAGRRAA